MWDGDGSYRGWLLTLTRSKADTYVWYVVSCIDIRKHASDGGVDKNVHLETNEQSL